MLGLQQTSRTDDPEESDDYADTNVKPVKIASPEGVNPDEGTGTLSKRIIHVCLLLVVLCFLSISTIGVSSLSIKNDIMQGESFIKVAEEMRPNFEDSLTLYTGNTQKIIDFLLKLRPQTEEEFITFITTLEKMGKDLSLKLDIKTLDEQDTTAKKSQPATITYNVSFYGSTRDLEAFVGEIDKIPYYINITKIRYQNLPPQEVTSDKKTTELMNISIELKLFMKKINANQ